MASRPIGYGPLRPDPARSQVQIPRGPPILPIRGRKSLDFRESTLRYTDTAMCGRFGFTETGLYPDRFDIDEDDFEALSVEPCYNAAPSQDLPVIYRREGVNSPALMRWGLVPSWAPDDKAGYKPSATHRTISVRDVRLR